MRYRFEADPNMEEALIEVLVKSRLQTDEVQDLLDYLSAYQKDTPSLLPIKTQDRIQMLKVEDLIYAEVMGDKLCLETLKGELIISERLYKFQERLANLDFVQVSRHAILNINHLEALEASFSGNMMALLTGNRKCSVSRRYLKNLEKRLGL